MGFLKKIIDEKSSSEIITTLIILTFLIVGPASALSVYVKSETRTVNEGEALEIDVNVNQNSDIRDNLKYIHLSIVSDNLSSTCTISAVNGEKSSICDDNFKITLNSKETHQAGYSYSYNYNYGYNYKYSDKGDVSYSIEWEAPPVTSDKELSIIITSETENGVLETSKSNKVSLKNLE